MKQYLLTEKETVSKIISYTQKIQSNVNPFVLAVCQWQYLSEETLLECTTIVRRSVVVIESSWATTEWIYLY